MTLVDTSIWIDHLDHGLPNLAALLAAGQVLVHPFVIGELAVGNLRNRARRLANLAALPGLAVEPDDRVFQLIERHRLMGLGIGYVDAHLLAAAKRAGAALWTRDRRMAAAARACGLAAG